MIFESVLSTWLPSSGEACRKPVAAETTICMVLNLEFLVLYNVRSCVELKGFGNKWLVLFCKRHLGINAGSTSKIRGQINTNFSDINLGPVDVADRSYARILNLVHSSAAAGTIRTRVLPRGILEAFRAFDTSYHSRIPMVKHRREKLIILVYINFTF